jgi:quercetin dioxygenase-like cupin family protein
MNALSRSRMLLGAALALAGALGATAAQQPPAGEDPRFTGKSDVLDAKDLGVSRRRFEPGARSAWHSHERGQLIYVEQGRARTQKRGQPMRELGPGESDYTGPNVVHWHGAAPTTHFIQVAVGWGGETKWMEKVTDLEYGGRR